MKPITPNTKYIAWRSSEELHEACLQWISELKFSKDEQHFLDELIKDYTLPLITNQNFEKSSEIINRLSKKQQELEPLIKKIIRHQNELNILIDGVDQPKEEKEYKNMHSALLIEVNLYFNEFKKVKRDIFDMIRNSMKQSKKKRLLT
ncbi:hypothetical protein GCM10022393_10840 [Aquimarina addita]|uniref:Uncharacterized protein n=1 Tax=Aquimarina addita TaxID=870485 RepID=A0ABP7XDM9_9FLAO